MSVACVLRSGGVYDPSWVRALAAGLEEHLPGVPLTVLTNLPEEEFTEIPLSGFRVVPLEHDFRGWWSKVECFRPDLFDGRVIYLDLDSLPVGDLSPLAAYDGPLAMLEDFYETGRTPRRLASGVMLWDGADPPDVYERFLRSPADIMQQHRARSDYWYRKHLRPDFVQDFAPGVVSLKAHARKGPPEDSILVCGHGDPRLSDPKSGWAHELWRDRALESEMRT